LSSMQNSKYKLSFRSLYIGSSAPTKESEYTCNRVQTLYVLKPTKTMVANNIFWTLSLVEKYINFEQYIVIYYALPYKLLVDYGYFFTVNTRLCNNNNNNNNKRRKLSFYTRELSCMLLGVLIVHCSTRLIPGKG